jgi:hypothetical protein
VSDNRPEQNTCEAWNAVTVVGADAVLARSAVLTRRRQTVVDVVAARVTLEASRTSAFKSINLKSQRRTFFD